MGGGSIQVLGFKGRWLSHKKNMCPRVLLFSDMDISSISWAEGRAEGRAEGLCGLRKDMAYQQASPQL